MGQVVTDEAVRAAGEGQVLLDGEVQIDAAGGGYVADVALCGAARLARIESDKAHQGP